MLLLVLCQKAIIHQLTTMLSTSKSVLFPGRNHLLTTGVDDPTFLSSSEGQRDKLEGEYHGGYLVDNFFLHNVALYFLHFRIALDLQFAALASALGLIDGEI